MRDAVIVEAVRTPVGKRNGALSGVHPVDLSAGVLRALAERAGLEPALVDDVIWGCVAQVGEQAFDIGRNAVLAAGWPLSVPGTAVDRQCGSSPAVGALRRGRADQRPVRRGRRGRGGVDEPGARSAATAGRRSTRSASALADQATAGVPPHQGIGAEMIAERWGLSRTQLDEFSPGLARQGGRGPGPGRGSPGRSRRSRWPTGRSWTPTRACGAAARSRPSATLKPAFQPDGADHTRATARRSATAPPRC